GYFQYVPFVKTIPAKEKSLTVNEENYTTLLSIYGKNKHFEGDAIFLNYGLAEDYENKDVKGKLIFVKAGTQPNQSPMQMFGETENKKNLAIENGAIGLVELASVNNMGWRFLENYFNSERLILKEKETEIND